MDDIEIAQRKQDDEIKRLLGNRRQAVTELGAATCSWCEDDIPMPRRQAVPGCTLCISCQAEKERLKS